ncbi:MAG: hypothetical protein OXC07_11150 [Kistimonas sp.]|nr:hypothetical protein [Kistimonas sp.]
MQIECTLVTQLSRASFPGTGMHTGEPARAARDGSGGHLRFTVRLCLAPQRRPEFRTTASLPWGARWQQDLAPQERSAAMTTDITIGLTRIRTRWKRAYTST